MHSINNYRYTEEFRIFYFIQHLVAKYIIIFLICNKIARTLMPRKEVSWVVGMTITALKTSHSLPTVLFPSSCLWRVSTGPMLLSLPTSCEQNVWRY